MELISENYKISKTDMNFSCLSKQKQKILKETFSPFLDVVGSATNRATHYNDKDEQQASVLNIHNAMFKLDRSIYGMITMLPGSTEYSRQIAIINLLKNPRSGQTFLTEIQEGMLLKYLVNNIAPHRMLDTFGLIKYLRINTMRAQKLILRTILDNHKLQYWAVKYKVKLRNALIHAWSIKLSSTLKIILEKDERTNKEKYIVRNNILKYISADKDINSVCECVRFILGSRVNLTLNLLKQYEDAKIDFSMGKDLPPTTLLGIRTKYHAGKVTAEQQLKQVAKAGTMTSHEKMKIQRTAKQAKIKVDFDPRQYNSVDLYKYCYQMGLTDEIQESLTRKASNAAQSLPMKFNHIGILVDTSLSMIGDTTQQMRPIAISLATRDMLIQASKKTTIIYSGYEGEEEVPLLPTPKGETVLAEGLLHLIKENPETIFILTDGYENCPAGRTAELISRLRDMDINTPIYQLSPVMAAESGGVRKLGDDVFSMPISNPSSMGISLLKGAFEQDIPSGVHSLMNITLPMLEGGN